MSNIKSEDLIARLRNGTKLPALQALLNEAADKIAEQDEKISVACFYMKEKNRAEDEGRVVLLDRETALAIAAGWRAIRTTTRLQSATYVYDPLGEDGGPYEIPYARAGEILHQIWDRYPLEKEEAEKAKENTTPRSIPAEEDTIYDMVRNFSLEDMAKAMSFVAATKGCCFPQDKRCDGKTSWCCGDCWKEYLSTKRGMGDGRT